MPQEATRQAGLTVVPLTASVGVDSYVDGIDRPGEELNRDLGRSGRVMTSRPSPQVFLDHYERLAEAGASEVLSIHLSSALSGTYDSARIAGQVASLPVHTVDSATMGAGLGNAVMDALACVSAGGSSSEAAAVATESGRTTRVLFCVASLDFLHRGGRIGAASAFLGAALSIRPVLELSAGRIMPLEKTRTMKQAVARLTDLVDLQLGRDTAVYSLFGPPRVVVHHVAAPDRARILADALSARCADHVAEPPMVQELGLVAAAHLGPGAVGVVISPPRHRSGR
ncbi:DegV family protein [Austwickia chelonae]|uniref:DegV family protein n=1 Tax=Austwickia chelonae TaxID=100225 RepID=UPI001F0841A1